MKDNTSDPVAPELARAQSEYHAGRIDAAALRIDTLFERYPDRADVLTARGVILAARGEWENALSCFEAVLANTPDNVETLAWAASAALRADRPGQAERHARRLRQLEPLDPRAHLLAAKALSAGNNIPEALTEVGLSLDLRPEDAEALLLKARLLRRWRLPGLSIQFYRRSLAVRPTAAAAIDLAQILLREGEAQAALDVLQLVVDGMPVELRPYDLIGQAQTQLGRIDESEPSWANAEKYAKDRTGVIGRRAEAEIAAGMLEQAASRLRDLLDEAPESARAFYLLTTARRFSSNDIPLLERMESISRSARLSETETAELNFALGKGFDDVGAYEKAMRWFDDGNRICNRLYLNQTAEPFDREDARRYTDALIEYFSPARFLALAPLALDSSLPLWVVGLPRSGTTLLSQVLTSHSQVGGGKESSFWPDRAIEFLSRTDAGFEILEDALPPLANEYLAALGGPSEGSIYAIDKNPNNFQFSALLHAVFPNGRILHMHRQPVAIALSMWMTPFRLDAGYASDRQNLAFIIREHFRLLAHFKSVLPESRFRSIRYEDLTNEPRSTIGSVLEDLDLEPEPACFRPELNSNFVLTPSAYQVRQPIHRRSQDRWKNYLPWLGELAELADDPW